jgi:hypothetical protein
MKTKEVLKILEENKITNVQPSTKELFVVYSNKTRKIIEGEFKDKKSAKVKRDELNKPKVVKDTKKDNLKKDSMPLYIIKKGKDHIHYA